MATEVKYELQLRGQIGPVARGAFADVSIQVKPLTTVFSGTLDQAALHDLLERIQAFGLELIDIRRARPGIASNRHPRKTPSPSPPTSP